MSDALPPFCDKHNVPKTRKSKPDGTRKHWECTQCRRELQRRHYKTKRKKLDKAVSPVPEKLIAPICECGGLKTRQETQRGWVCLPCAAAKERKRRIDAMADLEAPPDASVASYLTRQSRRERAAEEATETPLTKSLDQYRAARSRWPLVAPGWMG
jgi:hypothetical protein